MWEAEADVKRCKKAEDAAKSAWTDKEAEEAALKLEIAQLQKNLEDENQQLASTEEAIKGKLFLRRDATLRPGILAGLFHPT